jgi:hypothetical protein
MALRLCGIKGDGYSRDKDNSRSPSGMTTRKTHATTVLRNGVGCFFGSAELHDEAFCGAAGFEELGESDFDDVEAAGLELVAEVGADVVEDDGAVDVDGVAGEADGIGLADDDSFFGWVEGFDLCAGGFVEGLGKVHDVTAGEWGEAGVEVVEAWVDEVERGDLDAPDLAERVVAGGVGAGAVANPEAGAVSGEECVAFAFEGGGAGRVDDGVAGELEPAAEMELFALALGVEEAADGDGAVALEAGVGGEDHVGGTGLGLDELDVGDRGDGFVKALPLLGCAGARGGVDVAGHPWIDNVVDVVELGGTHEEGGRGGCDVGENRRGGDLDGLRAHVECVSMMSMEDRKSRVNTNDYAWWTYKDTFCVTNC